MFKLLCAFVLSYAVVGSQAGVVSFITPCKHEDKVCLKASAQHAVSFFADGIPSLEIPPADPLVIEDVKSDESDLNVAFSNMKIEGVRKCQFDSIEFTSAQNLAFTLDCPIFAHGKYNLNGKLFKTDLVGDGDFEIKTDKIRLSINVVFERLTGSDGKEHFSIKSLERSFEPLEQVHFKFDNLFNGDESKAKPILAILDASWKTITESIGKPIVYKIIDHVKDDISKFFLGVPADELEIK